MEIQFLYYRDCPSHEVALRQLQELLEEESVKAMIEIIEVKTVEQARALHFVGSPTILVNGSDIAEVPDDAVYGLTCRAYFKEDGRISPLPPAGAIRQAIHSAIAGV